jgi:hypothetical protein
MRALTKWACVLSCMAWSQTVWADTITLLAYPDIMSSALSVTYNATTGEFQATGFAETLTSVVAGSPETLGIDGGSFTLTANISNAGVVSSGAMTVGGCVPGHPDQPGCSLGSTLLQSSTVTSLTFTDIADTEFVFGFTTMSGDLQIVFGNVVHVKMNLFGFPGNFSQSFATSDFSNNSDVGVAVPSAIPEPSTWGLMISGLAMFAVARRKASVTATTVASSRST